MLNNDLKKNPFITPESYFDKLPSIIQERSIKAKRSPVFGLIPRLAFAGGGFVVAALILFLSFLHNSDQQLDNSIPETKIAVSEGLKPATDVRSKGRKYAMIDYLAVRNINAKDIVLAKTKY